MQDDLVRPVAEQDHDVAAERPWELTERFWPVLGGPFALTAVAYVNARRLKVGFGRQLLTLVVGVLALAGVAVVGGTLEGVVRWLSRLAVVGLCFLAQVWLQRPEAKAYAAAGEPYGRPSARLGVPAVVMGLILMFAGEEIVGSVW